MSTQSIIRQSPHSEDLMTETVAAQNNRRGVAGQRQSSQARSTSAPRRSSSPTTPSRLFSGRRRLTTTYMQGDFACGQRTLPAPVALVGTFANR